MDERSLVFIKPGSLEIYKEIYEYWDGGVRKTGGFQRSTPIKVKPQRDIMGKQYSHIRHIPAYEATIEAFTQSGIVLAVYSGEDIVKRVRESLMDVRERFGDDSFEEAKREARYYRNVAHASEDIEGARKDINLWREFLAK